MYCYRVITAKENVWNSVKRNQIVAQSAALTFQKYHEVRMTMVSR